MYAVLGVRTYTGWLTHYILRYDSLVRNTMCLCDVWTWYPGSHVPNTSTYYVTVTFLFSTCKNQRATSLTSLARLICLVSTDARIAERGGARVGGGAPDTACLRSHAVPPAAQLWPKSWLPPEAEGRAGGNRARKTVMSEIFFGKSERTRSAATTTTTQISPRGRSWDY